MSASVLVWENKMAVDLKPNLDDVSGHVIFTERKILDLMWEKYLNYTNKTYLYFQLTKLFTLAQWQEKKVI